MPTLVLTLMPIIINTANCKLSNVAGQCIQEKGDLVKVFCVIRIIQFDDYFQFDTISIAVCTHFVVALLGYTNKTKT